MASYSHGYYGLSGGGGSSKTADFGLAASMTLPMVTAVPDLEAEVAGHVTMPNEKRKRKKKARFSTDIEQLQETEEPEQGEVVLRNPSKKPSWRSRLSGIFRRNSTREEKREDAEEAVPVQEASVSRSVAESDLPARSRALDDSKVLVKKSNAKRKKSNKRDAQSRFNDSSDMPYMRGEERSSPDLLKLALRPKNASSDFKDIRVTLRRKPDGFGIHLSGGLPPISVTYVQPGSEAESARIIVGDFVTEVNGHDCRKAVGISRIMELKTLIQQTSIEQEETTVDDGVWEKIKEKQEELESDNSEDGEITRIDDTTESEEEPPIKAPQKIETPKVKLPKEKSSKVKQPKATVSLEIETPKKKSTRSKSPKVDYEPVDMNPKSSTPKKSTKKKKKRPAPDLDPLMDTSAITTPLSSPIKDLSKSGNDSSLVTVGIIKKPKRKKTESRQESKQTETDGDSSLNEKSMNRSSLVDTSATTNEYASYSNEPVKKLKKKKRKSVESPPATSEVDDSMTAPDDLNQSNEKLLQESSTVEVKPRDSESKKVDKTTGKSKKKAKPMDSSLVEPASKKRLKSPASGSGSKLKTKKSVEESDDLEWVDYAQPVAINPVDRRKSVDIADQDMGLLQINSQKRSTSYHDLDKEERKMFREELRQASKSEYDIKEKANGGPKVDINPDVKVKKSGKVVAKRNKRPTILEADGDEVGNENGEEILARKKGKRRQRNSQVMDVDISVVPQTNPSLGLKHGHEKRDVVSRSSSKRRPASKRKTLLLDSKKEVLMGNERVDLSESGDGRLLRQPSQEPQMAVSSKPETVPEKPQIEEPQPAAVPIIPPTTTTPPEQSADVNQPMSRPRRQSIIEYMESLQKSKYNSLSRPTSPPLATHTELKEEAIAPVQTQSINTGAAKGVFEAQGTPPSHKTEKIDLLSLARLTGGGQKIKTVDQPVKKLGIASEPVKKDNVPSWVSLAQSKRNRASVVVQDNKPDTPSQPTQPVPPASPTADSLVCKKREDVSIPKMGTVLDRLSMFQRK